MFLQGYLLFGLLLAGVPIGLHLLLRQKPRRVVFPAFRFLAQRKQTNQRRMQLRHLLLLLLRVTVIAVLVLAFARPRLFGDRIGAAMDRPVVAALLFDTSPSMGYTVAGMSRLDEALSRCRELLDELEPTSRVALIDSGESAPETLGSVLDARSRLKQIQIRSGAGPLNRAVERALDFLARHRADSPSHQGVDTSRSPAHLLVIFSDRTRGCWDARGTQPVIPDGVSVLFVDVGSKTPVNLGIESVELTPTTVAPGGRYVVRVRVRGTIGGHENEVTCQAADQEGLAAGAEGLNKSSAPTRQPVTLTRDQTQALITFEQQAPKTAGPHGLTFRLGTRDALAADDARYALLTVRGIGKMLTLVESDHSVSRIWNAAQEALGSFTNEVRDYAKAESVNLSEYNVVTLCQPTRIPTELRRRLLDFVRKGGGLAVVPGGEETVPNEFNVPELFPAPLVSLAPAQTLYWARFGGTHSLMLPFVAWSRSSDPDFARDELRPLVRRYWKLGKLADGAATVAAYENSDAALAERVVGRGRVLLFTTPLDIRRIDSLTQWTNYWQDSSFGLVLIDRASRYLAGEEIPPETAFICGTEPSARVPTPLVPPYTIEGPGLTGGERKLRMPAANGEIAVAQAKLPGNYLVRDGRNSPASGVRPRPDSPWPMLPALCHPVAGFSLNIPAGETDLDSIPQQELEAIFGEKSLVEQGKAATLRAALSMSRPSPVELMPYLLLALLAVMTLEGVFANRFYRDDSEVPEASATGNRGVAPPPSPTLPAPNDSSKMEAKTA